MKSTIKKDENRVGVFYRILPAEKMCWNDVKILEDRKTIYIRCNQDGIKNQVPTFWTFQSDQVFVNDKQQEIYTKTCSNLLGNVIRGHNGIIAAFGQTGTGKSSTINGVKFTFDDRGIIPRIITDLFKMKKSVNSKDLKVCIEISYIEISRNHLNDLLKPYPCFITNFNDLTKIKIKNDIEGLEYLFLGEARKDFYKNTSYSSHCNSSVFTFHISTKDLKVCNQSISSSRLHIIDLAGADTVGNFSCQFKNASDIGLGNLAKSQLEQFLLILNSNIQNRIRPNQRLNPLLQYLGDSLHPKSILRFIGHLRISDLLITTSMLRFGQMLKSVKPSKTEQELRECPLSKMFTLQQELTKLKTEFTYNSILMNQNFIEPISKDRYAHIERTVLEYLEDKTDKLALINTADVSVALEVLKNICKNYAAKNEELSAQKTKKTSGVSQMSNPKSRSSKNTLNSKTSLTGQEKLKSGSSSKIVAKSASKDKVLKKDSMSASATSRSINSKKLASSSASIIERSSKKMSKNELNLMPEIAPEFNEAWQSYLKDRKEEYTNFSLIYEKNQTEAKTVYNNYLKEINLLRQAMTEVESRKHDLILAKLTSDYQADDNRSKQKSYEIAATCEQLLQSAEFHQTELQEVVLKWQSELRAHLEICRNIKEKVKECFDAYCTEKYNMLLENLDNKEDDMSFKKILSTPDSAVEEEVQKSSDVKLEEKYEHFKRIMAEELKRKKKYLGRKKEWVAW